MAGEDVIWARGKAHVYPMHLLCPILYFIDQDKRAVTKERARHFGETVTLQPDSTKAICQATASDLVRAFAKGDLSPVEVARASIARAEAINPALNAFVSIDHERALASARAAEQRWKAGTPLSTIDGVPTTIKDIVRAKAFDVRYGSLVSEDISDLADSPSVERLRGAGAVLIGLTTTPEFGWKAVTDSPRNGITRNPWSASQTPGGSSGGAAVAAATGAGVLHLGTDGGGSIRIPASFCGIVGHKPSFGTVPAYPASSFGSVAHIGPMARSVEDVVLMLNAMSGKDIRDWAQQIGVERSFCLNPTDWAGARIGYWKTPCVGGVDGEVQNAIQAVLGDLEQSGASVSEIALPDQDQLLEIFYRHWHVGAALRLSSIDPARHGELDPGFLEIALRGQRYSAVDRMQAEIARGTFGAKMDALLQDFDYILSPTTPIPAFEAGANTPAGTDYKSWVEWSSFSFPINLSQQPACSVPCGRTRAGLPIGLQIIGTRGADKQVLSAALAYQNMYPERFLLPGRNWPLLAEAGA